MNILLVKLLPLLLLIISCYHNTLGQCIGFPASTASDDCANYAPLTDGANINSGETFSVCHNSNSTENYNNINLNGGMIRICGNATLSGNFNSGTIVVECGATLSCPNGLLLNSNVGVVNYGTVEVIGDLNFQNSNVYFYNESPTSRLFVSGNLQTAQNTNQTNYIKNRGYISVRNTLAAREGSFFCLAGNSVIDCANFIYMQNCGGPSNRFTKEDALASAILRHEFNASLRSTLTNNDSIKVLQASGASVTLNGCGSFGNATIVSDAAPLASPNQDNCNGLNCFTLLPVELLNFEVKASYQNVDINWSTSEEKNNKEFEILQSIDGMNWTKIQSVPSLGTLGQTNHYQFIDTDVPVGILYYRLKQIDKDGGFSYSNIKSVFIADNNNLSVSLYPNPANDLLQVKIKSEEIDFLQVFNLQGQIITDIINIPFAQSTYTLNTASFPTGIYLIKTNLGTVTFAKQ